MPHSAIQPGGQDWLAIWRQMYDAERAQGEAGGDPAFHVPADFWASQAERLARAVSQAAQPDGFMRFLLPRLRAADHVLDIGAGTGRYEPILAEHVGEVTAVEPSEAMRHHLALRSGPSTRIISGGWPDPSVPACDVAIAAHVLYSVREIGPFLTQMHAIARRAGYLLLAYRHPMSYASPFWEAIHGEPRRPLPAALECLAALYQLGIPASLTLVPIDMRLRFESHEAALTDIRHRLRILPDSSRDARILKLVDEQFEHLPDGGLAPRGLPEHAAVVWWEHS